MFNPPSFSKKKYCDYLPPLNIESFFITPTGSTEVSKIISSLNQDNSNGPNSIPIKVLKLLNKDTSNQLVILFNQSFITIKKSKQFYFTRFFQENIKDLKNMLKGIKKTIYSNHSNNTFPTAIS